MEMKKVTHLVDQVWFGWAEGNGLESRFLSLVFDACSGDKWVEWREDSVPHWPDSESEGALNISQWRECVSDVFVGDGTSQLTMFEDVQVMKNKLRVV